MATTTKELPTDEQIESAQQRAMTALAANVRLRRKALGMTQEQLAAAVQRTQGWVHQLERGLIRDVPHSQVVALGMVLGVSVSVLTKQRSDT